MRERLGLLVLVFLLCMPLGVRAQGTSPQSERSKWIEWQHRGIEFADFDVCA